MSNKLSIALVGCGHIFHSPFWAAALKEYERVEFRGLWDHDTQRAQTFASEWGVDVIDDLDALLADASLSAVAICAENNRHADLITRAAKAGKHVFCEKPIASTFKEIQDIKEALKIGGAQYFQSFPKRFDPINQAVKKILDDGRLGKLSMARLRHGHYAALRTVQGMEAYQTGWFTDPEQNGGGSFLDEGVHAMDCLRWFFGDPQSVCAKMLRLNSDAKVDEGGIALFQFANGLLAEVATGAIFPGATNTLEIFGERGALILQGTDLASKVMTPGDGEKAGDLLLFETSSAEREWTVIDVPTGFKRPDFHKKAIASFVDGLLAGTAPTVNFEDGQKATELTLAGYESARNGNTVTLPFTTDRAYHVEELI